MNNLHQTKASNEHKDNRFIYETYNNEINYYYNFSKQNKTKDINNKIMSNALKIIEYN